MTITIQNYRNFYQLGWKTWPWTKNGTKEGKETRRKEKHNSTMVNRSN